MPEKPDAAPEPPQASSDPAPEASPAPAPEAPAAPAAAAEAPAAPPAPAATAEAKPAESTSPEAKDEKAAKPKATKAKAASKKAAKEHAKTDAPAATPAAAPFSLDDEPEKPKIIRAKGSKNITRGIAHIKATFNNTIVSITDMKGAVIAWSSAGKCGFKGSRKSTAYAAQVVAQDACRQAMGHGLKEVEVEVKGPGSGRESAVRAIQAAGLEITSIRDVTPVPHNGCRPPKRRRV